MPELDSILTLSVGLFVFYIELVIHTNIGRYGGLESTREQTLDARRNIHISPHLQELCNCELAPTSGSEHDHHTSYNIIIITSKPAGGLR